jgi:hypothetical protein
MPNLDDHGVSGYVIGHMNHGLGTVRRTDMIGIAGKTLSSSIACSRLRIGTLQFAGNQSSIEIFSDVSFL